MDYTSLYGLIIFISFMILFFCIFILSIVLAAKRDQRVREYILTLDEHDKAVIARYHAENKMFYKDMIRKSDNEDK